MQSSTVLPEPKTRRSYFWLAFALSFVLTAAVSCSGAAMLLGLGDISLADLQSSGPQWTPPPGPTGSGDLTVLPGQSAADTPLQPGRLQPGISARNVAAGRVNIRRTPGYLGKSDDDIVAQMEQNTIVVILDPPQVADQLIWWRIRFDSPSGPVEGWVAESTASGVQILSPE
ncbi:MAG: hypothetical protein KF753_19910 [Caldilineaceae bacterium]|nr:hypothetical protein [Caldilineaceae bacterium]